MSREIGLRGQKPPFLSFGVNVITLGQKPKVSLNGEQRAFFAQHGWLLLRALLDSALVESLLAAVDAVVPPSWVASSSGRVLELAGASRASPAIAALSRYAHIGGIIAEALGAARLQLLQDTLFIKAPRVGGRVEWHQDFSYLAYLSPPRAATLRLALTRETEESGCLRVLDGSHRWGHATPLQALSEESVKDALGQLPRELRDTAAAAEVSLPLEPGDATLHHCLMFHSSAENRSGEARKTIALRAFDAACTVLRDRLPAHARAHFPLDDRGALSAAAFPVVYDAEEG